MEVAESVMVSTISFIQAKLQHSIASSRVLTGTAVLKGIDMALIRERWCREGRSIGPIHSLVFSLEGRSWQEPEPSHVTGMALAHCILDTFLGVVCHCFTPPLDVHHHHHSVLWNICGCK